MWIELLYFEGCPGFAPTLGILERVVAEEGLVAEIVPVALDPHDPRAFFGSPTVLVDGEDLFPTERRGDAPAAPSCRIYATPEGPKNHPTAALVRAALAKRSSAEQPTRAKTR